MRSRRTLVLGTAIALIALLAISVAALWTALQNIAPRSSLGEIIGIVDHSQGSLAWKIEHHKIINILLLARGGTGNDNPNVTDTMIVASLHPRSPRAVLISLPRFAWVSIPALASGDVSGKLYSAYALAVYQDNPSLRPAWRAPTGAGDLAAAAVARMTGLSIDGWIIVDIEGFRGLVDALGGISLNVPANLDDPAYPVDDSGHVVHVRLPAGHQFLDGALAVEYARSRLSTSESDRSRRQELVMVAIASRLHTLSLSPRLLPVLGALQGRLLTSLRLTEARQLAAVAGQVEGQSVQRVVVDESNFMYPQPEPGGDMVLLPRGGSYEPLRRYLVGVIGQS